MVDERAMVILVVCSIPILLYRPCVMWPDRHISKIVAFPIYMMTRKVVKKRDVSMGLI